MSNGCTFFELSLIPPGRRDGTTPYDIELDDVSVSRLHAIIKLEPNRPQLPKFIITNWGKCESRDIFRLTSVFFTGKNGILFREVKLGASESRNLIDREFFYVGAYLFRFQLLPTGLKAYLDTVKPQQQPPVAVVAPAVQEPSSFSADSPPSC